MSELSFEYLSTVIKRYFRNTPPNPGERFHIHVEKDEQVQNLYQALLAEKEESFSFEDYDTGVISLSGIKLIITASGSPYPTESFLTRLRNKTAAQEGVFENMALLIVHNTSLDSIIGGSEGLTKEGNPLHISIFKDSLKDSINELPFHENEKAALKRVLNEYNSTIYEDSSTIFAYNPFMAIIQKRKFEPSDWIYLGMFPDPELIDIDGRKIGSRVSDNREWFEKVERAHRFNSDTIEDELRKYFIKTGVDSLKGDDWEHVQYGQVKKWSDEKKSKPPNNYLDPDYFFTIDELTFWERGEGNSAAARRKRHIIIFNPDSQETIHHELHFERAPRESYVSLDARSSISYDISSRNITVSLNGCSHEPRIERIRYDDTETNTRFSFNIAVLPFSSKILSSFKSNYLVDGRSSGRKLRLGADGSFVFNKDATDEQSIALSPETVIHLSQDTKIVARLSDEDPDDDLRFTLDWSSQRILCEVIREAVKPTLINGVKIWKWKREQKRSFEYADQNKLIYGNNEYFTNKERILTFLELENDIISKPPLDCFWIKTKDGLEPRHLDIDDKLRNAFVDLLSFYNKRELLPSLTSLDESTELLNLCRTYIEIFINLVESIEPGNTLTTQSHNLMRIGTIESLDADKQIFLTPLHPLNICYQLEIRDALQDEDIPEEVLSCLGHQGLLPYINGSGQQDDKFASVLETELMEWTIYRPVDTPHRGWHNEYVHKLIAEKISEYVKHFPYLFSNSGKAPIRINIIHMGDSIDALKGVIRYYQAAIREAKGNTEKIQSICLHIYGDQKGFNIFEQFALYGDPEKICSDFEVNLSVKFENTTLDKDEVLRIIRDKLDFYLKEKSQKPDYAHITFFKFDSNAINWTYHDINTAKTGCSLSGLVNAVPSIFSRNEYITGFGKKDSPEADIRLMKMAGLLNALARVSNTAVPFTPTEATFSTLMGEQKEQLDSIYDSSNWVTFIEPKVDLNFFKMHEKSKDLIIIHYSDQYNNTSGYNAITVTRKSQQYRAILREFLDKNEVDYSEKEEMTLVNMFNAINGDWLLRLISNRAHYPREKISILSGVKTMLAVLHHTNIVWVPLSLEEVLRVTGSTGLKQTEGLFSVKNLDPDKANAYCDDLLMAGVEISDGRPNVHLLPVEVKIGSDQSSKGKLQSSNTADILKEHLDRDTFRAKFYRNFLAKLIVVAAEKMQLYNVFPEQDWNKVSEDCRRYLLNDDFDFNWSLKDCFGKVAVLSFKAASMSRKIDMDGDSVMVNMLERDGYENLLKDILGLHNLYNATSSTINEKLLLCNCYKPAIGSTKQGESKPEVIEDPPDVQKTATQSEESDKTSLSVSTKGMKILFGHEVNSNDPVYWHPNDTNRIMHTNTGIIGTMGTGKTQFTKSLVTQLVWEAKNNVNGTKLGFLIFDYKGDYIKEDFIEATGAKRYDLHRLPYNPLALTVGDKPQPMLPLHTANAIKESIATAFNLGIVQKQKLRDCIMNAYEEQGIDKSDPSTWNIPAPTLANVCGVYLNDDEVKQDSLYAAMDNLNQFEIFEPDSSKTKTLFDLLDGVVVINLSGYDQDIQNLVVAITLDQFYSQMQKAGHSAIQENMRELTKMVLVDEADNFLIQNFQAIRRILKEGREFGVGTILSTQFLNHFSTSDNEYSKYILSWIVHRVSEISQKEISALFGMQSKDRSKEQISEIMKLEKHHSVVNLADNQVKLIRDEAFFEVLKHRST